MMTTKKRRPTLPALAVIAAAATLLSACSPPGARQLREGERDIQSGQFAAAIAPLKDATRVLASAPRPAQSRSWNLLGLAYQGTGQLEAASQAYLQALKFDHDNSAVDFNLGCLRMEQGNFPGALDYLTTYVALRPREVSGYLKLGAARFHLALEKAGAERARQLENARLDFETADKVRPTAESANAVGMIELQRRNGGMEAIRAAGGEFQTALQREPHYAPALLNLAIIYQRHLNDFPSALQKYREYLALQPPPPHAKEVGQLEHQLDLDSRITIGSESGQHPAPSSRVIIVPGNASSARAKPGPIEAPNPQAVSPTLVPTPASEREITYVPAQSPTSPSPTTPKTPQPFPASGSTPLEAPPSVNTATPTNEAAAGESVVPPPPRKTLVQKLNPLHWFSGKPKAPAKTAPVAVGTRYNYPSPVTLIPGDRGKSERLAERGAQARGQGHLDVALQYYRHAIAADPTYFDANLQLGLTAIDAADYTLALDALYRALALKGNSADARYAFAWTLGKRGYYIDAASELEKLLTAHPQEVRAHLLLGNMYAEKLSEPQQAREQYAVVLELDPGNSQAAAIRAWVQGAR